MSYPFGEVILNENLANGLVPDAFIYKFLHMPTHRWYIGMHGLKEDESPFDGTYWNSSTDNEFLQLLLDKPKEFKYEITHYGSMLEMFKKENEILVELDAQNDKLSWNKWNGFGHKSPELPRLDLIDSLADDAYDKKSSLERKTLDKKELIKKLIRLQVRFNTQLSHKKISEYRNEMNNNGNSKGFTLTIVRKDGQWVLVGGNHTLEALDRSKVSKIEVVFIDEDLTMDELQALGNALNRKKEILRMTTDMEDIADDLVNFYYDKKITDDTFKNKYCTDYIKITGGFKGNDITKVRKIAREIVKEKNSWKKGKKWINWNDDKIKVKGKKTRKEMKHSIAEALTDGNTLCLTSSATFRSDRINIDWLNDTDTRKELKLKPRGIIKILMHYADSKTQNEYVKSEQEKLHKRLIENNMRGEGVKNPLVVFEDLDLWEDKV